MIAACPPSMALHRLVGDIQAASGQPRQFLACRLPREGSPLRRIIRQVGWYAQIGNGLADDARTVHGSPLLRGSHLILDPVPGMRKWRLPSYPLWPS